MHARPCLQALAEAGGFAVAEVPLWQLAEEYRDGSYSVLRLAVRDASVEEAPEGAPGEGPSGGARGGDEEDEEGGEER